MFRTLVFVLVIIGSASQVLSAENQRLDRIRFGYSSISGSRIALWVTSEMGFFSKNGLAAEAIVTPGIQGTQALIAGELQFYLGGVDSAALSASRGSDLVALATAAVRARDRSPRGTMPRHLPACPRVHLRGVCACCKPSLRGAGVVRSLSTCIRYHERSHFAGSYGHPCAYWSATTTVSTHPASGYWPRACATPGTRWSSLLPIGTVPAPAIR